MLHRLHSAFRSIAPLRRVVSRINRVRYSRARQWWPPGHFYSPIPSLEDLRRRESAVFDAAPTELPGVDLRDDAQQAFFEQLVPYYRDQPFSAHTTPGLRYYFENDYYGYCDGLILHCLLRHLRPRRYVEIGSGFSSALMLDTSDQFLEGRLDCTFIEPYPDRLKSLLRAEEVAAARIIETPVQEVDTGVFQHLEAGDILFIDSTHVCKVDSDVCHILFRILPAIPPGVYVHFHDIFYPFEYPREWVFQGWAWNEAYALRAFLQYNAAFQIVFFNSYFHRLHAARMNEAMPLSSLQPGSSLWLQKLST